MKQRLSRPQLLTLLALSSFVVSHSPAWAAPGGPAKVVGAFKVLNKTKEADNFEMVICLKNANGVIEHITGPVHTSSTTFHGIGQNGLPDGCVQAFFIQVSPDKTVPVGETGSFNFELTESINTYSIRADGTGWTSGNSKLGLGGVGLPEFSVVGDPIYTIVNGSDTPMGVRGLSFLFDVPEVPFETIVPGSMPGFGAPLPDFILPPGGSFSLDVPQIRTAGNFMYAQGLTFDATTGEEYVSFTQGHQAVPEPSALALLFAAGVGGLFVALRRRNNAVKTAI